MGDKSKFTQLKLENRGSVSFGDNSKGTIVGIKIVGANHSIAEVSLVKGLKFNLISVSQLCDKNRRVIFEPSHCEVQDMHNNQTLFVGDRFKNVYFVDFENFHYASDLCLASVEEDIWL